MANNKVLSIDITNDSITIVEITASGKKQTFIHRVLIFETPEDSYEDGLIKNQSLIAGEIRNQLASNGITVKNAVFVMNSTKIVNREIIVPYTPAKKIGALINANSSDYFPVANIEDYVIEHTVLEDFTDETGEKKTRVMAVAAPETMVRSYYDLAAAAGLKCQDLDYIGNSMLQLIKTQTTAASTTAPVAYLLGFALYSCISATNNIFSNNLSTPSPLLADILLTIISPPHSSGVNPFSTKPDITLSILASSLSILLIATIIGTSAALA